MAFVSVTDYDEELYKGKFRLSKNGESADVIFLYQSKRDMMKADVHYIKSPMYSGYVHCFGTGCPICAKKKPNGEQAIRKQTKIFIPVYNIYKNGGEIEFWDRYYNRGFVDQLDAEIFDKFPNPSEYVIKITREGGYKDQDTRYHFTGVGQNLSMTYQQILAKFNAKMPDYYENIVKTVSMSEANEMLNSYGNESSVPMQEYIPTPRAGYQSSIPDTYVDATSAVGSSEDNAPSFEDTENLDAGESGEDLPDPIF